MGRRVDLDDLVSAVEIARRLNLVDRNIAHNWLRRYPAFPRPAVTLSIGHIWIWPDVAAWAAETGRGRWELLPPGVVAEELVPLRAWTAEHGVPPEDLLALAGEELLPLAKRGGRFYLDPGVAAAVWGEHGERMLAKRLVVPGRPAVQAGRSPATLNVTCRQELAPGGSARSLRP